MQNENEKLTPAEIAAALGVGVVTVYRWKKQGCPCIESKAAYAGTRGSRPRYNLQQVRAWLDARTLAAAGKEVDA